jgi:ankyrin repeat protein
MIKNIYFTACIISMFVMTQASESNINAITDAQLQKLIHHSNNSSLHIVGLFRDQTTNIPLVPETLKSLLFNNDQNNINQLFLASINDNELRPLLLAMGADINTRSTEKSLEGGNCLWHTTKPEILEELIAHGAEINTVDKKGNTPLSHLLRSRYTKQEDVIAASILLKHGADLTTKPNNGLLHNPMYYDDAIICFTTITLLCQHGIDVNRKDSLGYTPLIKAIKKRRLNTIKCLLQHKADANMPSDNGTYPLHAAIEKCDFDGTTTINPEIVRILLKYQANPNQPYKCNVERPLHRVIKMNLPEIIKTLLIYNAEKHHHDSTGYTAHKIAEISGYSQDILDLLSPDTNKSENALQKEKCKQNRQAKYASAKPHEILDFSMTDFSPQINNAAQTVSPCSIQ